MNGPPPVTLQDAVIALTERKTAIHSEDFKAHGEDVARLMFVGFDLDFAEVKSIEDVAAQTFVMCAICNPELPVNVAIGSAWVDGVLTGLMLAELRAKKGSA